MTTKELIRYLEGFPENTKVLTHSPYGEYNDLENKHISYSTAEYNDEYFCWEVDVRGGEPVVLVK